MMTFNKSSDSIHQPGCYYPAVLLYHKRPAEIHLNISNAAVNLINFFKIIGIPELLSSWSSRRIFIQDLIFSILLLLLRLTLLLSLPMYVMSVASIIIIIQKAQPTTHLLRTYSCSCWCGHVKHMQKHVANIYCFNVVAPVPATAP